ncbi:hypothetical protein BGZ74_007575 [Mortierella antarctica]|nr:hypothetical protein BGZ74_007575 [Mortierella antarctica]
MSYQIPRHINIATYATYLVMDTLMNLFIRQERKSMARFFNDYLAIVLVIAYARIDLSENTHWNLFVVTFSGGWIWPIIVLNANGHHSHSLQKQVILVDGGLQGAGADVVLTEHMRTARHFGNGGLWGMARKVWKG